MIDTLSFDQSINAQYRGQLGKLAAKLHGGYVAAKPYPHVVIDNLFDDSVLTELLTEFPNPRTGIWKEYATPEEIKLASRHASEIPPKILAFLSLLNSAQFLEFLETVTGIGGLISDPYFEGGGLHQIVRGGKLGVHADFNRHKKLRLDRRLNLLVYLNKGWQDEYGGHFELWDHDMTACQKKILPLFNRTVLFGTTDYTYHGHPDPLLCPEGVSRKSFAFYYYSNGRPEEELSGKHTTLFRRRPGETLGVPLQHAVRMCLPPILIFLARRALGSLRRK